MKKKYASPLALLLPVLLLVAAACDKASPVAPAGTVLTISVSPSQITANGTATVIVTALKPNGTPVNPGTAVRFSTSLGTIDPVAEIGDDGVATATLRGTGEIGTATVTARAGTTEAVTAEVQIGKSAGSVTVQATPSQVDETGGTIQLLAVVRDDQGEPLANAAVNFQTEVGRLASGGAVQRTNANGQVRDTLTITQEDTAALNGSTFRVAAVVGGSGGATQEDTATISINQCEPEASFVARNIGNNTVQIERNLTTGADPIDYFWDFDSDGSTDSTERNPQPFQYGAEGTYTIGLRAVNDCGEDTSSQSIRVTNDPP